MRQMERELKQYNLCIDGKNYESGLFNPSVQKWKECALFVDGSKDGQQLYARQEKHLEITD